MFSLLKKKQKPSRERDLEQTISAVAEHHRSEDLQVVCALMKGRRVFVPADANTIPSTVRAGDTIVTGPADRIRLRTVIGPEAQALVPCATSRMASILVDGFVEMDWTDFLAMVVKMDASVRGVLLQGERSWITLDRERVSYVLSGAWESRGPR